MNSESISNLHDAYQQALNGKPSQYPLIDMVSTKEFKKNFFRITNCFLGYSVIT
jgi:hypothetical protein